MSARASERILPRGGRTNPCTLISLPKLTRLCLRESHVQSRSSLFAISARRTTTGPVETTVEGADPHDWFSHRHAQWPRPASNSESLIKGQYGPGSMSNHCIHTMHALSFLFGYIWRAVDAGLASLCVEPTSVMEIPCRVTGGHLSLIWAPCPFSLRNRPMLQRWRWPRSRRVVGPGVWAAACKDSPAVGFPVSRAP